MIRTVFAAACFASLPFAALAESHITGDAEAGEKVFRKCMACHAVGADAKNKVGPVLNGVVGRAVGSIEDFRYSDALQQLNADGVVWTPEELAAFLEKPRDYAKGTKMAFAGLRKEDERQDVIAYLATFGADGM
ncbi:cytochrome c family protein [Aestuariicoccus sp. MJ-SS9]|uniref:c-type cytochrome n=1 Tax=Aestuariicoccus sp. MJ-SS9 TaxID=3079855 RepID=UPI002911DEBD|nr:cytochrome c family protein [Aestuariicoccus sp. MJ-SS9]MDU8910924.1 cytochrome c family protein [Aestuariicoccus sp. MJ-SS9]